MSETYNIHMYTFNDSQPEEFLALIGNWKIVTDRTNTTSPSVQNIYLRTLFSGEILREFNELEQ